MHNKAETEAQQLLGAIKERDTEKVNDEKDAGWLCAIIEQFVINQKRYFNCGAGTGMVAVSCSDDVYLCHRFVGTEGQRLGDIFNRGLNREMYLAPSLKSQEKCANCHARYL